LARQPVTRRDLCAIIDRELDTFGHRQAMADRQISKNSFLMRFGGVIHTITDLAPPNKKSWAELLFPLGK